MLMMVTPALPSATYASRVLKLMATALAESRVAIVETILGLCRSETSTRISPVVPAATYTMLPYEATLVPAGRCNGETPDGGNGVTFTGTGGLKTLLRTG